MEKLKALFAEFPPISTQEWENSIANDLKGADYNKKLVWKTIEGFDIKPFFRNEDIKNIPHLKVNPAEFPYLRGNKTNNSWEIRADIDETDVHKANIEAIRLVSLGAQSIGFRVKDIIMIEQMETLLQNIDLEIISIHFASLNCLQDTSELFLKYLNKKKLDKSKIRGSFNFDPLGFYLMNNKFYGNFEKIFRELFPFFSSLIKELPLFKIITVNGHYYHNSGATIVDEIAFSLLQANEYVSYLTDNGIEADDALNSIMFSMASGSSYFFEIAKFRAFRMLWANIANQFHPKNEMSKSTFITSTTSVWNKTLYDPQVNMLRSTTETMSAILGNVDAFCVNSYNSAYTHSDDFSSRIAQNIQLILREESYFDKVADPVAGSYYIEYITDAIAKAAWEEFKKLNEKNDFVNAITSGYIKEKILITRQQRDMDIALRRKTLLGTNQYPNSEERMLEKIQTTDRENKTEKYLEVYRGAEAFEELRLQVEIVEKETGKLPKVFLFTIGNLKLRLARALFVKNFFSCAGYQIIDNVGFESVDEGVKQSLKSSSDIVVICSSDEEYESFAPEICKKIKKLNTKTKVLVAGHPTELIEMLKIAGIDDFVHIRTNVIEMLTKYNNDLYKLS